MAVQAGSEVHFSKHLLPSSKPWEPGGHKGKRTCKKQPGKANQLESAPMPSNTRDSRSEKCSNPGPGIWKNTKEYLDTGITHAKKQPELQRDAHWLWVQRWSCHKPLESSRSSRGTAARTAETGTGTRGWSACHGKSIILAGTQVSTDSRGHLEASGAEISLMYT